jgi:cob(I)alamin adenosyltransferase
MKIYTGVGDEGQTALLGGAKVAKDDPRIAAYGTVDELNATLGVCRASGLTADVDGVVAQLQQEMFVLGAELASPEAAPRGIELLGPAAIERLERTIDRFDAALPPLRQFILPGGTVAAAALHQARCVCRRAERELVALSHVSAVRPPALVYINRVGDLLFVLARSANAAAGVADVPWEKPSR